MSHQGPQGPFHPHQGVPMAPPPPAPKVKKYWSRTIVAGFIGMVLGGGITGLGGSGGEETAVADPQPTTTTAAETPKKEKKAEPTEPKEPEGYGDGIYLVGEEMPAGRYKTTVPTEGFGGCYWERTSDDSGEFESIIANEHGSAEAKMSVTVKAGEFFKSDGCGEWVTA